MITGTSTVPPLLYQGTGLVADRDNPLVLQILSAHSSAYSYIPDEPIKEVIHHINVNNWNQNCQFTRHPHMWDCQVAAALVCARWV